jgi:LacI family transcriptional regulator
MVTIKDVAERAGVSITTVSHVINETRYVSEKLTEKVYAAMRELDYKPNIVARSLRSGSTKTIGLIIPDISNPFFSDFSRKIEDIGFNHGYNVILCNTDEDRKKEEMYVEVLISKQVDGLVFIATGDSKIVEQSMYRFDVPVVITDREAESIPSDIVLIDNYSGGYKATKYLISLDHKRIAYISGPSTLRASIQRFEGYQQALIEAGIVFDPELVRMGNARFNSGEYEMHALLNLENPPTAVFAFNDLTALGAMRTINNSGKQIPQDISIIGFDDISLSTLVNPQLTTVSQPIKEMAELSVELLVEKIHLKEDQRHQKNLRPEYQRIMLDTELIIRGSAAKCCSNKKYRL